MLYDFVVTILCPTFIRLGVRKTRLRVHIKLRKRFRNGCDIGFADGCRHHSQVFRFGFIFHISTVSWPRARFARQRRLKYVYILSTLKIFSKNICEPILLFDVNLSSTFSKGV